MLNTILLLLTVLPLAACAGQCAGPGAYQGNGLLQIGASQLRGAPALVDGVDQASQLRSAPALVDGGDEASQLRSAQALVDGGDQVLSVEEIAIKFGDKVDERGCHSVITVTRPEPEEYEAAAQLQADNDLEDRTGTRFAVGLEDVAVAMISGRDEFFNTSHETVLRYLPRGLLIKATGACPCSFRAAFSTLKAAHPDAKWYYVGDEDALIDLSQLRKLLSKYNSSAPVVVASNGNHRVCESCGACPAMETSTGSLNSRAFYGGNGQIFSAGLLQALDSSLGDVCMEATNRTLDGFGDLENTCNLARSWQPSFRVVQLVKSWEHADAFLEHTGDFISAHHLCADNIRRAPPVNGLLQPVRESLLLTLNGENDGCQGGSEGQ